MSVSFSKVFQYFLIPVNQNSSVGKVFQTAKVVKRMNEKIDMEKMVTKNMTNWSFAWCSMVGEWKKTWLLLWTFYNITSTHKVPSWVDSFTSSQKKSSESSTQKKSSTVLAEKQKPSLLQIWCAQNGWPTVICQRSPSNLNLCTPFTS